MLSREDFDPDLVRSLAECERRKPAPGVKVTAWNFGRDRRYPIVNRFRNSGAPGLGPDAAIAPAASAGQSKRSRRRALSPRSSGVPPRGDPGPRRSRFARLAAIAKDSGASGRDALGQSVAIKFRAEIPWSGQNPNTHWNAAASYLVTY
jgi:hypothetical protein